jgi:hypothetical protein
MTVTDSSVAVEADPSLAPGLLLGATTVDLPVRRCGLDYWVRNVAQGTLAPDPGAPADPPEWMFAEGPLRAAMTEEFTFRSLAEEKATRALSYLVVNAPSAPEMDFFATQLLDEARHASDFRGHLVQLGTRPEQVPALVERVAGPDRDRILAPLEEFGLAIGRDSGDFIGGVVVLTVLVEGVLAPAAEMSERKWKIVDPPAAHVERLAGVDEIRHLSVGTSLIREHLVRHPDDHDRLRRLVARGQELWSALPVLDLLAHRERLFQQGIEPIRHVIGDYQIWPGRRLIDTTADERVIAAAEWAGELQASRLAVMGLA